MAYRWKDTNSFDDEPLWLCQDRAGTVGAQRPPWNPPLATGTGILLPSVKLLTAETVFPTERDHKSLENRGLEGCSPLCTDAWYYPPHMRRPFWVNKHKKKRKVEKGKKVSNFIFNNFWHQNAFIPYTFPLRGVHSLCRGSAAGTTEPCLQEMPWNHSGKYLQTLLHISLGAEAVPSWAEDM